MHWEFYLRVLPAAVVALQLEKKVYRFYYDFANFTLKTRLTQLAFTVWTNIFIVVSFQNF